MIINPKKINFEHLILKSRELFEFSLIGEPTSIDCLIQKLEKIKEELENHQDLIDSIRFDTETGVSGLDETLDNGLFLKYNVYRKMTEEEIKKHEIEKLKKELDNRKYSSL